MKITVRIFIQKHADRSYTVTVPAVPGISAYGLALEECRQEIADALARYLAEVSPADIQHLVLRPNQKLEQVSVEVRPTGPDGKRRRNILQLNVHVLVTPQDDGQLLVTVPRLSDPPLAFYCASLEELPATAQAELAQYFYGRSLEEIMLYQGNRYETIDEMEVEFKPRSAAQKVAETQDEQFWALRQCGLLLTAYEREGVFARTYRREPEVQKVLDALAGE
jgi:predicted RNase H-like HicB family nuclease